MTRRRRTQSDPDRAYLNLGRLHFSSFIPLSSPPPKPFFFSFSFLLSSSLSCDSLNTTRDLTTHWSLLLSPSIYLYLSRLLHLVAEETTFFILC